MHALKSQIGVPWGNLGSTSACQRGPSYAAFRRSTNRGARIRTGDLCDPNAALYRTEPRPGSYSGTNTTAAGWD